MSGQNVQDDPTKRYWWLVGVAVPLTAAIIGAVGHWGGTTKANPALPPANAASSATPQGSPKEPKTLSETPVVKPQPALPKRPVSHRAGPEETQGGVGQKLYSLDRASKVERYVGSAANDQIQVFVRETQTTLYVRMRSWSNWEANPAFDVNKNNRIDPKVDVSYHSSDANPLCTLYLVSANQYTSCNSFKSLATVTAETEPGGWTSRTWSIPKIEVSEDGKSAWLVIDAYNNKTETRIAPQFDPEHILQITFRVN